MVSLRSLFPFYNNSGKSPRTQRLEAELVPVIGELRGRRNEVHAQAKDFEQTVTDFLNDRKQFEARRNER
jgi:hypothetical protein